MKTLIVEDDCTCQKLLQAYLKDCARCDLAASGQEALDAFDKAHQEHDPYDLILLDITMPEINGHETLWEIRQRETQRAIYGLDGVKVIMTTALDAREDVMTAFRNGCESYLVKPVSRQLLLNEIESLDLIKT